MNRTKLLSSVAILSLLLAGCSQADDAAGGPEAAGSQQDEQQSQEQAKAQEAERVKQVKAEVNRLADGYDYDAAMKLVKDEPNEELNSLASGLQEEKDATVAWEKPNQIPHLFFHSLVIDTDRAFDGDGEAQGYKDYMVTQDEFSKILDQLYERDYVLVNPTDFAKPDKNGR
ncbi:hypothetical protein [Arthrobacter sp. JCM 19049]|uniref:hypothetical protein n=1 Tax=Arthrobacter sp. JCM 19049 TaxID=1460643 RepID=UPI002436E68E|nr:hypothetical protein [Arthrobacter sp. JCM 19049]